MLRINITRFFIMFTILGINITQGKDYKYYELICDSGELVRHPNSSKHNFVACRSLGDESTFKYEGYDCCCPQYLKKAKFAGVWQCVDRETGDIYSRSDKAKACRRRESSSVNCSDRFIKCRGSAGYFGKPNRDKRKVCVKKAYQYKKPRFK